MKTTLVCTKKYNKEEYKFFLNEPEYEGEKGILGMEIKPYVSVTTPENDFGYSDMILLSHGKAYTLHRPLPKSILEKIEQKMKLIMEDLK